MLACIGVARSAIKWHRTHLLQDTYQQNNRSTDQHQISELVRDKQSFWCHLLWRCLHELRWCHVPQRATAEGMTNQGKKGEALQRESKKERKKPTMTLAANSLADLGCCCQLAGWRVALEADNGGQYSFLDYRTFGTDGYPPASAHRNWSLDDCESVKLKF